MNLCSDGHEEICHEGRNCPVCEIIKEKDGRIEDLENKVQSLEEEQSADSCSCSCGCGCC